MCHRVTIGGVYKPTFLQFNSNHLMHTILGGLEFAPIATLRTGSHFTVYDCTNGYNACPRIVGAPDLKFKGTPVNNGGVNSFNYLTIPSDSANPYVDAFGISDLPPALAVTKTRVWAEISGRGQAMSASTSARTRTSRWAIASGTRFRSAANSTMS